MKTLHQVTPPIPEDLLLMATGLISHFPEANLRLAIIYNQLRYSFSGWPTTPLADHAYWSDEGRRAQPEYRQRAENLLRQPQ